MKIQKLTLRLGILLIFLALSVAVWLVYFLVPQKNFWEVVGSVSPHPKYFSQLDGRVVTSTEAVSPNIVVVMIDNFPDVYPQSCLGAGGSVVYEAPAEGVTTRFMQVVDAGNNLPKVGPVRSARSYYLDWLAEYGDDALYMHCGGAPEALTLIKTRKIFDANEFYWGPYYWRDQAKIAPHNLYTSHDKWTALLDKYTEPGKKSVWNGWKFSLDIAGKIGEQIKPEESIKEISIKYYPGYKVTWRYLGNVQPTFYARLINDNPHHSTCSSDNYSPSVPITAQNILVQFVRMETVDEIGRKEIKTIGSGDAYVLRNGRLIRGQWKKENLADRTRFYDNQNQEISLIPGNTWVQIVPVGTTVEVTN